MLLNSKHFVLHSDAIRKILNSDESDIESI